MGRRPGGTISINEFSFYIFYSVYSGAAIPKLVSYVQSLFHINDMVLSDLLAGAGLQLSRRNSTLWPLTLGPL